MVNLGLFVLFMSISFCIVYITLYLFRPKKSNVSKSILDIDVDFADIKTTDFVENKSSKKNSFFH